MLNTIPLNLLNDPALWGETLPAMSTFSEHRRTRRFTLQLPLSIRQPGGEHTPFTGITQNISSGGVLFTADREADLGSPIEYIVTLNSSAPEPVNLRCVGKVVRSAPTQGAETPAYQIAATLERYEFLRGH